MNFKLSLQVDNLSAKYGNLQVLWDISLRVEKGEIVSLIGANGAGKSTLLKTILGLVRPLNGSIIFDREGITELRPHSIVRKGIGYVPEGRRLFPQMSIEDNLRMGAPRNFRDLEGSFRSIYELFPMLRERKKQKARTLSGGEQQMVAIGRAMVSTPKLLLLDELSFGLAPSIFERAMSAIIEINKKGVSVLLAEQNSERALEISDRSYVLENGKIVMQGASRDLIGNPEVKTAFLGISE